MEENKKIKYIMLLIVVLLLIAINIIVFMNNYIEESNVEHAENKVTSNIVNELTSSEVDNKNRENKIASLNEKSRMQTYFGTYISYIEAKNYKSAYDLLYDGFKQTYFPTLQDFEQYAKTKYPNNMIINYTNITREGTIYVLTLEIRDVLNSNKQTEIESTQVVVMEEDINKFKISFEVQV